MEKALGPLVEELLLPPDLISKISEGHIDETWAKMLADLDRRTVAFKKKNDTQSSSASQDLGPLLEKLTFKVWETPLFSHITLSPSDRYRQSNVSGTSLLVKSKLSAPLILMRRSSSSRASFGSKISSPFFTNIMQPSPTRFLLPT